MKRRYSLLLALTGILAYMILLPRDLAPAFTVTPVAAYDLLSNRGDPGEGTIPFAAAGYVGFLDGLGRPLYVEPVRYGADAAESGFVNYDSVSMNLVIRDELGGMLTPIDTRGYPFYLDDRLLVVSTDRLRLKEFTPEGEVDWRAAFPSMITTVAGTDERYLVGMLNGSFWFLDAESGEILYRHELKGSRIRAAYGAAADSDTGFSLVVAGADPQQAFLFEERGGELRQLQQFELPSDIRRNIQIAVPLAELFVIEQEDALLLLDQTTLKRREISLPGRLLTVAGLAEEELLVALVERSGSRVLVLAGAESSYRGELVLPQNAMKSGIEIVGERLFVFLDDRVLIYRLGRV